MDHIDKIIYINLDKREDRKKEIEEQFKRANIPKDKIIRFSAVSHHFGDVGCSLSHVAVLKMAHEMKLKNVLILEDDFNFIDDIDLVYTQLDRFFKDNIDYEILFIHNASNKEKINDYLSITQNTANSCGYIVNSNIFLSLAKDIEDAVIHLERTRQHWNFAIDRAWVKILANKKSYAFNTYLGYQRPGWSDVGNGYSDNRLC